VDVRKKNDQIHRLYEKQHKRGKSTKAYKLLVEQNKNKMNKSLSDARGLKGGSGVLPPLRRKEYQDDI
jgi:hypothetical protein